MHDFSVYLVSSAFSRDESLVQQFVAHDEVQSSPLVSPLGPPVEMDLLTDVERLEHKDSPSTVTQVVGPDEDGNMVLVVHENTHNSPKIQHGMELWHRVREYDEKTAEMPFTPVLSKHHKQKIKKQLQVRKSSYRTRSRGDFSPTA